jgi:hypothetical protein
LHLYPKQVESYLTSNCLRIGTSISVKWMALWTYFLPLPSLPSVFFFVLQAGSNLQSLYLASQVLGVQMCATMSSFDVISWYFALWPLLADFSFCLYYSFCSLPCNFFGSSGFSLNAISLQIPSLIIIQYVYLNDYMLIAIFSRLQWDESGSFVHVSHYSIHNFLA